MPMPSRHPVLESAAGAVLFYPFALKNDNPSSWRRVLCCLSPMKNLHSVKWHIKKGLLRKTKEGICMRM